MYTLYLKWKVSKIRIFIQSNKFYDIIYEIHDNGIIQ